MNFEMYHLYASLNAVFLVLQIPLKQKQENQGTGKIQQKIPIIIALIHLVIRTGNRAFLRKDIALRSRNADIYRSGNVFSRARRLRQLVRTGQAQRQLCGELGKGKIGLIPLHLQFIPAAVDGNGLLRLKGIAVNRGWEVIFKQVAHHQREVHQKREVGIMQREAHHGDP